MNVKYCMLARFIQEKICFLQRLKRKCSYLPTITILNCKNRPLKSAARVDRDKRHCWHAEEACGCGMVQLQPSGVPKRQTANEQRSHKYMNPQNNFCKPPTPQGVANGYNFTHQISHKWPNIGGTNDSEPKFWVCRDPCYSAA